MLSTISSIIGAALLLVVAVMEVLLIIGLPLGEFTMGGRYKVWPPKMRGLAVSQLLVQGFALYRKTAIFNRVVKSM